jgi:predicted metal-dependent HD superfamily phosphohydrolase
MGPTIYRGGEIMDLTFDAGGFGTKRSWTRWSDVIAVGLRTTDDGPWSEDVFWHFVLRDGSVEVPGSSVSGDAIDVLHRALPGLDSRKIVEAMGTAHERIFRLWHTNDSRAKTSSQELQTRFGALVGRLGGRASTATAFERLFAAWGSCTRRYHGVEHLADCLRELDEARVDPPLSDSVELALWYHDAVYEPCAKDNEARSAAWLLADARSLGLNGAPSEMGARLVEATQHGSSSPSDEASDLVCDIDLAILGRDPLRFMEFEYGVGEEYASVPSWLFRLRRGRFLASLLGSHAIYRSDHFRHRYEVSARVNLRALLDSPRYAVFHWLGWLPC